MNSFRARAQSSRLKKIPEIEKWKNPEKSQKWRKKWGKTEKNGTQKRVINVPIILASFIMVNFI